MIHRVRTPASLSDTVPAGLTNDVIRHRMARVKDYYVNANGNIIIPTITVSYTHLDVYKRQSMLFYFAIYYQMELSVSITS